MWSGKRKLKHAALAVAFAGVLLGAASAVLGLVYAKSALFVEGGGRQADIVVVLGGDPGNRVFRGLELYKAGDAPKILISGRGDCYLIRDHFLLAGVSSNALLMETNSASTMENAEFSIHLMKELGMRKAIVVTSWWHSRRALACFRHFGPEMEFSSYPSYDALDMDHKPSSYEVPHVFREYPALAWYWVRYGIGPFWNLSTTPASNK